MSDLTGVGREPGFAPCYRHPDRATGISCQRCQRPTCGECMVEASVGFQCPECARWSGSGRAARTRAGARIPTAGSGPLTAYSAAAILVAIKVIVGVANLLSGVESLLVAYNPLIAQGEVWRLVTHSFTSGGLLVLAINALFLFFICRSIEAEVGRWRLIATFLLSGFGAASVLFAFGPAGGALVGGLSAVLGLLAMNAALKFRRGDDIKPDLIFLAILVVFNLLMGGIGGSAAAAIGQVLGILGGAGFGAATGLLLAAGRREGRTQRQVVGMVGLVGVGALLVAGRLLVG